MAMLVTLSSCELIGDIFKAGVWAGVLMVVGVMHLYFSLSPGYSAAVNNYSL